MHVETRFVQVTPTVTAGAYTAKDCVGDLMTFADVLPPYARTGRVTGVIVTDKADQAVEYDLLLFKSLPGGTFTNDAAVDPTDADLLLMLPVINLATTDHFSFTDNGVSSLSSLNSSAFSVTPSTNGATLYGALVTRGTPTYAGTSDITVTLIVTAD